MVDLFVIIFLKGEKLHLPPPIGALLGISFYQGSVAGLYIPVNGQEFFQPCTKMRVVSERKSCRPTTKRNWGGREGGGRDWENGGENRKK